MIMFCEKILTELDILNVCMFGEMTSGIQFGASSEHGSASFRCLLV